MAKPFDLGKLINPLITEEDSQLTGGPVGGGGGGITPTPTPTPTGGSSGGECSLLGNECPPGFICQVVSTGGGGLGFFAVPTFTTKCVPIPAPTPTPTPTPTGEDTGRAKIRCCGPTTNYTCADALGTACPRGTAECTTAGESCKPPAKCVAGPSGPRECRGKTIVQKYRNEDCSEEDVIFETCSQNCIGGKCEPVVTCTEEFIGENGCSDGNVVRTYRKSDCSTEVRTIEVCSNGCKNATCNNCPPRRTFLGCTGSTGRYANGSCGENTIPGDARCTCVPRNPPQFSCEGTTGVYNDGCSEIPERRLNDPACITCTAGYECDGTTAVVFDGTKNADGTCKNTRNQNDTRCIPTCGGNRFGVCPPNQICIPIPRPGIGIEYFCGTGGPTPTPTPTPSPGDEPTPTPTPSGEPTPTPTPTPVLWRNCVDGKLNPSPVPSDYKLSNYLGIGGGVCWEPRTVVSFEPDLATAFNFVYQRGSENYQQPISVKAINPAYSTTYEILFETNSEISINPPKFTVSPRNSTTFTLNVMPSLYEKLGDGDSTLKLNVDIQEV